MAAICLTVAGSDSSGGAGIQADLKTFAALGCYGASVITALTAQNSCGIRSIAPVDAGMVRDQLDAVLADMPIKAVKIGMLPNPKIVETVADRLATVDLPIVLDPVLKATSGTPLTADPAIEILLNNLVPICSIVTPNLWEAEKLTGRTAGSQDERIQIARYLIKRGADSVLITGGDLPGTNTADCLVSADARQLIRTRWFTHPTIQTPNTHGTGCTLSSAIAANLSLGLSLEEAVEKSIQFVQECLVESRHFKTGTGNGGLNHFFHLNTNHL